MPGWKGVPERIFMKNILAAAMFGPLLALTTGAPAAETRTFESEFSISLYGLPLARTSFTTTVGSKKFSIKGAVRSAGVGAIFDDTRGDIAVDGQVGGNGVRPGAYALTYVSGKKNKSTNIGFSGGSVVSTQNVPPVKPKGEWIEVQAAQLKAVSDPLTGMVVRASSLGEACNRTVRVFDGQTRADFVMSLLRMGTYKTKGYSGPVAECAVRFVPVSGYQKGKKQLEFLRRNKNIRMTFAPIGGTGLYAPIAARVGTTVGTVAVDAVRFEAVN
jgi:Protein of unknown function (DUF3108)